MSNFKKCLTVLGIVLTLGLSSLGAYATEVGVVNLDDILANYTKAQDIFADLQVKEADFKKFVADAQKQLKDVSTPLERKNLEEKLTNDLKLKSESLKDLEVKQNKLLEDNVYAAINSVSKSKKLDVVMTKASVLTGGTDITNDVLTVLNAKK